jgi:hypothetical protein
MKILGYVFLAIIAVGVLTAIALGLASLSDIRRYFKIRAM